MNGTDRYGVPPSDGRDGDELVSAVLDGVATPDEVARVHADAALSARLAAFRDQREALLLPGPTELAARRGAGRTDRATGARRGAAVAAAAAVLVAIGLALVTGRDGTDQMASDFAVSTTTSPPAPAAAPSQRESGTDVGTDAGTESDAGAASRPSDPVGPDGASTATGAAGDLGTFPDRAALERAVAGPGVAAGPDGTPLPCVDELAAAGATALGTALVDGRRFVVGRAPDGTVTTLDVTACTVVPGDAGP